MQMRKDDILISLRALIKQVMPAGTKVFCSVRKPREMHDESDWDILILLDKEKITSADFDTYAYPLVDLGWQFSEYLKHEVVHFHGMDEAWWDSLFQECGIRCY